LVSLVLTIILLSKKTVADAIDRAKIESAAIAAEERAKEPEKKPEALPASNNPVRVL